MGNSVVSQPQVPQVQVQFLSSWPETAPQTFTVVSQVFTVLQPCTSCNGQNLISWLFKFLLCWPYTNSISIHLSICKYRLQSTTPSMWTFYSLSWLLALSNINTPQFSMLDANAVLLNRLITNSSGTLGLWSVPVTRVAQCDNLCFSFAGLGSIQQWSPMQLQD